VLKPLLLTYRPLSTGGNKRVKINFQALGCRLNEAELESWSQGFIQQGHQLTRDSADADLVVFNSCSVTAEADRKSRKLINQIHRKNPQSKLVVTGCYASLQAEQVKQQLGVDLVIDNQHKEHLVSQVLAEFNIESAAKVAEESHSIFSRGRHRAFIKVQDGCRYKCTFCIVTVARGDERSRSQQDIINEINQHHQQGVQELAIAGVHVGGYGSDTGSNLYELLSEILDKTAIPRIRLASVEPWDLPDNFFELFKDSRLMPHIHLPLQSGSDSVLRRMARRCKTAEFENIVDKARSTIPLFNITTDLIVGFPGETEAEWTESLKFVEKIGFGDMHIFSYSAREGTKAARLEGQIPASIKKQRSSEMHLLAETLKIRALKPMVGNTVDVLWEKKGSQDLAYWNGYTPQYHKIKMKSSANLESEIAQTRIDHIDLLSKGLVGVEPSVQS
jgi:threonylcarbamoyladenosine tRNA methylthiotransferase MtaB